MLAKRITKWRRRIAFLLLSIPDQCIVSTALTNAHAYVEAENRIKFNEVLRDMERNP